MEEKKTKSVIDPFTVFYCTVSFLIMFGVLSIWGNTVLKWYEWLLAVFAPFIVDGCLTVVITVYVSIKKVWLYIRKRIYEKKYPPKQF